MHPIETFAETLIARLRRLQGQIPLPANGQVFLEGLWGSFDAEQAVLSGSYEAGDGALLKLAITAEKPGRWCTLALMLGEGTLDEGDVVGLVADLRSSRPASLTLCLRSMLGGSNRDVVFDDGFVLTPEGGAQVALLRVPQGSVLCAPDQRLVLLLELPQTDLEIVIQDLRLFVVPALDALADPEAVSAPPVVPHDG